MIERNRNTGELKLNRLEWEVFVDDIIEICETESDCEFIRDNMLNYFESSLDNKINDILQKEEN